MPKQEKVRKLSRFFSKKFNRKKTTKPMNLTFIAIELSHIGIFEKETSIFSSEKDFKSSPVCFCLSNSQLLLIRSLIDTRLFTLFYFSLFHSSSTECLNRFLSSTIRYLLNLDKNQLISIRRTMVNGFLDEILDLSLLWNVATC